MCAEAVGRSEQFVYRARESGVGGEEEKRRQSHRAS